MQVYFFRLEKIPSLILMKLLTLLLSLSFLPLFGQTQTNDNACLENYPLHIVVMGSSTAAGTGPSHPDSTWVNRYRRALQAINPAHRVTNIARGGYNTYRLMPSSFVPPPGLPLPDSTKNITQAISLSPDAIIINLPSNDAALNVSAATQMQNFRTMVDSAQLAGIPVWICTTQPRVFSSSKIAIQLETRDSILTVFGHRAIDFWTGLADSAGLPLSQYDSGDGVHLNDAGHNILFERVRGRAVADTAFAIRYGSQEPSYEWLGMINRPVCSGRKVPFSLIRTNVGTTDSSGVSYQIHLSSHSNGLTISLSDSLPPLESCTVDTLVVEINLPEAGNWDLEAILIHGSQQDTLSQTLQLVGERAPVPLDESICLGETVTLRALSIDTGTFSWYISPIADTPLHIGDSLSITDLSQDTTFWVSVTGERITFRDSLQTLDQYDRDWNGIMIDLIPKVDLILDTLFIPISTTGNRRLKIYTTQGSYLGKEQSPQAWQLQDSVAVSVASIGSWIPIPLNALSLQAGDTTGLYLHLAQSNGRLRYQAVSTPQRFENDELSLITGTGISHTFGQTYYPRMINAAFSYRYEIGPCESVTAPLQVDVTDPTFYLGNDTSLMSGDTLQLTGPLADRYLWSTGDTTASVTITQSQGINDTVAIWLTIEIGPGCQASDTLRMTFSAPSSLEQSEEKGPTIFTYYPDIQAFQLHLQPKPDAYIWLMDGMGRKIYQWEAQPDPIHLYSLPPVPPGIYGLVLSHEVEGSLKIWVRN